MADQTHPRDKEDSLVIEELINGEINDQNLAELARLLIRYQGFPGARRIQRDLQFLLEKWQLTEEELFEKTRKIHHEGKVYRQKVDPNQDPEDWS
jgi:Protein of unknown function (DUF3288)